MKNLDVINALFGTPDSTHLRVTLTLNNLITPPPPNNIVSGLWAVYWRQSGDPDINLHVTDTDPYCPGLYAPTVTPHWMPRARDTARYRVALAR